MKRALYFLSAAMLIFVASCTPKDLTVAPEGRKMKKVTIKATPNDSGAKTTATWNEEESKYKIAWEKGDELSVFDNSGAMYKFTSKYDGATTEFDGEIPEESSISYAVFPYEAKATVAGNAVYTDVPYEQDGDFGKIILAGWKKGGSKAEVAYDLDYQFEAVCGIIKFHFDPAKIAGKKTITTITLISDLPVSGSARISYDSGKPVMTANPNATESDIFNVVNLYKEDGFSEGDYYMAVFPINAKDDNTGLDITIRFETSNGDVAYIPATLKPMGDDGHKHIFAANIVKNIGTAKIENYDVTTCEFSVASDKKVYFSPGNLQYQASTKTWRFALNQWDVQGNEGNATKPNSTTDEGARATQSEWIDLFRWGHSGCTINERTYLPYDSTGSNLPETSMTGDTYKYLDWGIQNPIRSGYKTEPAGRWRLLSYDELNYMTAIGNPANYRKSSNNPANATKITATFKDIWGKETTQSDDALFLRCKVSTGDALRYGMMIFPDNFTWPADIPVPYVANSSVTRLAFNYKTISKEEAPTYTLTEFAEFEKQGAIFLPCAGYRNSFDQNAPGEFIVKDLNVQGRYFTNGSDNHLSFDVQNFSISSRQTSAGWSVRLVRNATGF